MSSCYMYIRTYVQYMHLYSVCCNERYREFRVYAYKYCTLCVRMGDVVYTHIYIHGCRV